MKRPSRPASATQPRSLRTHGHTPEAMSKTRLAVGISAALMLPLTALAAEQPRKDAENELQTVKVEDTAIDPNPNAQPGVPYKAQFSGDQRHTRPLAETPQTIQTLTAEAIKDSGYTDLRNVLDSQPGITLGTGENGNAFGDRYIIRGQEARSDVFVDGLRDPGMSIRESFAIEQLEITKGPNSTFAGRGSAGGAINAITKQATRDLNFAEISAGIGSDAHTRLTLDANQAINDKFAVRANVLDGYEEIPDRDPADRDRQGVALSGLFAPTQALDITLDYYHLDANDNPDLGGFLQGTVPHRKPADDVPVYAQKQDFLESQTDTWTSRINYKFSDTVRLSNLTRYGQTENGYVATGARATTTNANNPDGVYDTFSLSTHQGWQDVDYFANQTSLFVDVDMFNMIHEFVGSVEYSNNKVLNGVYDVSNSGQNCATGTSVTLNSWCGTDASGNAVSGLHNIMHRQISKGDWDQDWAIENTSLSLFDTVDVTGRLTAFGGLRYDIYDYSLKTLWDHDGDGRTGTPTVLGNFEDADGFWNGHAGLSYKLSKTGNVYFGYGTAKDVNGGESDVGSNSGYGGLAVSLDCVDPNNANPVLRGCNPNGSIEADPESSTNMELGTKWNLLDETLLLSAAVFQIDKTDVMEGAGYTATGSFNTGENEVRGIELGASGEITDRLMLQAGVAVMDAEVTKSITEANEGKTLSNFAEKTAFAQLKYGVTENLWLGAAAKYESEKFAGQPDTAPALTADEKYAQPVPAYTVYDVFGEYKLGKHLDLRLNIGNVTNEEYYLAAYRSGSFLYYGDARNYRLTVNYKF